MRKIFYKIIIFLTIITITFGLYLNSNYFIKNQNWKYSEGINIGDWLNQNDIEIQNRIIIGNNGKAKIYFCFGKKLIVENIETGEKGYYVNKN